MRHLRNVLRLILILLIFSCSEKDESKTTPDKIIYHKSNDDLKINTVRYYTQSIVPPTIQNCPSIPTPEDSTASMSVDINGDSIQDFVIEAEHNRLSSGCGSHCICSYYRISIIGQNNKSWISSKLKNNMDYVPIEYDSLAVIQKDSIWRDRAFLYLDSPDAPFSADFETSFIGIKINNNFGWIKITPVTGNGLKIIDYAINLTENNIIMAGQQK
jgi:hypothetical protein